ncbi:hypothetical protein [Brucella pseudintermedia]|uniref:hypothetical protein n=1 Tax=Brucella pseudintermedia TaxID=370111 RepID=UPI000D69C1C5|nr:hypothetical protein [Brucella pseudintermedia]KAB2684781.1 hypothetical protein F9K78_04190 [Brucella pseudintermedia]
MTIRIHNFTPARSGAGNTLAWFDAEFSNGLKVQRLKLVQTRNGYRIYGPRDHLGQLISMPIPLADEIAELVLPYWKAVVSNAEHRRAAA